MSREKIRHLVTRKNRDGSARHYWQPSAALAAEGWKTRRLSDDRAAAIGEAQAENAKLDAWREARLRGAGRDPAGGGDTVRDLIAAYRQTRHWPTRPKTITAYEYCLRTIEEWAGDEPAAAIAGADVQKFYEAMFRATPAKAAAVVRMLRQLYNVGLAHNLAGLDRRRHGNPAEKPGLKTVRGTQPVLWPHGAAAIFAATADALGLHSVGDMVTYGEWLGHYTNDLIRLKRENYRDGIFRFRRAKTGAYIPVPHSPAVATRVEAALARQDKGGIASDWLVLNEATGRPYRDETAFGKKFRLVRKHVAEDHPELGGLWFMWVRHTAIVRLAEAECTDKQIGAITGHSLKTIAQVLDQHYFQPTEDLARQAAEKRMNYEADKAGKKQ